MYIDLLLSAITTQARTIASGVILCVVVALAIAEIVLVILQKSDSGNISAIAGGQQETFYGKNKGRSLESKLKLWTIILGVLMVVLCVVFFIIAPHV